MAAVYDLLFFPQLTCLANEASGMFDEMNWQLCRPLPTSHPGPSHPLLGSERAGTPRRTPHPLCS